MSMISSAVSGIQHATIMFDRAAQQTIKYANSGGDLVGAVVEQKQAEIAVKANTAVVRVADDMEKRLLDILA